jgi:hypothetical protein
MTLLELVLEIGNPTSGESDGLRPAGLGLYFIAVLPVFG